MNHLSVCRFTCRTYSASRCSLTVILLPVSFRQNFKLSLPGNIYHKTIKVILEKCLKGILFGHKIAEKKQVSQIYFQNKTRNEHSLCFMVFSIISLLKSIKMEYCCGVLSGCLHDINNCRSLSRVFVYHFRSNCFSGICRAVKEDVLVIPSPLVKGCANCFTKRIQRNFIIL